jgi:hypothetical protein
MSSIFQFKRTANRHARYVPPSDDTPSLSGLQYAGSDFTEYADTTALLADVSSIIGGTGDYHTVKYNDGNPGSGPYMSIDDTVLYNGHPTMKFAFDPANGGHPQVYSAFQQWGGTVTMRHFWYRLRLRFSDGFHTSGPNVNASGAYKLFGWGLYGCDGSGRVELTGAYDGIPSYEIYDSAKHFDQSDFVPTTHPDVYCGSITDEWTGPTPWMDYIVEHKTNDDNKSSRIKFWRAKDGNTPVLAGTATTATSGDQDFPEAYLVALAMNFNQPVTSDMAVWYGAWEVVDGSVHSNPFGLSDG